ncbi:MAG: LLM class flavin-dependent oxidoreductase, partial [Actinomycetota bacterium]|nr:LLM class flavin-dependent oxidoreductase [Actinomycetota bacterium]
AGRPVGCLFLVPLWHPVLLAEQVGTLATLAEAPFVLQVGMGSGAGQFAAMGVPVGERVRRTEESVRVVKALLRGETVDSPLWGVTGARVAPEAAPRRGGMPRSGRRRRRTSEECRR